MSQKFETYPLGSRSFASKGATISIKENQRLTEHVFRSIITVPNIHTYDKVRYPYGVETLKLFHINSSCCIKSA